MTAMLVLAILGLAGGLVSTGFQIAGGFENATVSRIRRDAVQKAERLASQISKVQGLKEKLINAYQANDLKLGEAILYSSPFSSTYDKLKGLRNQIQADVKKAHDQLTNLEDKISKEKGKAESLTGASSWADEGKLEHVKDYSTEVNKLVQGGMGVQKPLSIDQGPMKVQRFERKG